MFGVVDSINKIAGSGGSVLVFGLTQTLVDATSFIVREDTEISEMTGQDQKGNEYDLLDQLNITGQTLLQNDFFPIANGIRIKSITLTSGSLIAYT